MFNLTVMMEICGISTCVGHITGTDSSNSFFRMTISIYRHLTVAPYRSVYRSRKSVSVPKRRNVSSRDYCQKVLHADVSQRDFALMNQIT